MAENLKMLLKAKAARAPREVIDSLREALRAANLESYSGHDVLPAGIRVFLDSYAVPAIRGALAWAEGGEVVLDASLGAETHAWAVEDVEPVEVLHLRGDAERRRGKRAEGGFGFERRCPRCTRRVFLPSSWDGDLHLCVSCARARTAREGG